MSQPFNTDPPRPELRPDVRAARCGFTIHFQIFPIIWAILFTAAKFRSTCF